jgi:hypothetical protein
MTEFKIKLKEWALLLISLILSIIIIFSAKGLLEIISEDFMKFLVGVSFSIAGFGLVVFQLKRASKDLKKDFLDVSILTTISSILGLVFLSYPQNKILSLELNFGHVSSFFFLWGVLLFLIVLIDERFGLIR